LDALQITAFEPGDELGWPFDRSEFSVTVMYAPADSGGEFVYVPGLRSDDSPNYDEVAAVLAGNQTRVRPMHSSPGTLAFFHGRNALHRVTPVTGRRARINSVLTYGEVPGMRLNDLTSRLFYGRTSSLGQSIAFCGWVRTTMTTGPPAPRAALNSCSSSCVVPTSTAWHPHPRARAVMPSPGRSSPGTPGASSSTANDLRMEYSSLRMTTYTTGSLCCAAVHRACTEYWDEPSPIRPMTGRVTPRSRSASATPTAAGTAQP